MARSTSPTAPSRVDRLSSVVQPITGNMADFDTLLDDIGESQLVLIGEGSHGTDDFYQVRADITRRLIEERGFDAVAAEADWPDAFRVNRYVRNVSDDPDARASLDDFRRFP